MQPWCSFGTNSEARSCTKDDPGPPPIALTLSPSISKDLIRYRIGGRPTLIDTFRSMDVPLLSNATRRALTSVSWLSPQNSVRLLYPVQNTSSPFPSGFEL